MFGHLRCSLAPLQQLRRTRLEVCTRTVLLPIHTLQGEAFERQVPRIGKNDEVVHGRGVQFGRFMPAMSPARPPLLPPPSPPVLPPALPPGWWRWRWRLPGSDGGSLDRDGHERAAWLGALGALGESLTEPGWFQDGNWFGGLFSPDERPSPPPLPLFPPASPPLEILRGSADVEPVYSITHHHEDSALRYGMQRSMFTVFAALVGATSAVGALGALMALRVLGVHVPRICTRMWATAAPQVDDNRPRAIQRCLQSQ